MKLQLVVLVAPVVVLSLAACQTRTESAAEEGEEMISQNVVVMGADEPVKSTSAVSPEESAIVRVRDGAESMAVGENTAVSPEERATESTSDEVAADERGVTDTVVVEEWEEEETVTDDVVVDELGDEGAVADAGASRDTAASIGAAQGRAGECGLAIEAISPGAVADPCMTNDEFMRSLGLSEAQMTQVQENSQIEDGQ